MHDKDQPVVSQHQVGHGSVASYTVGFVLSILLTIVPFTLVMKGLLSGWLLAGALLTFAVGQLLVQLVFFLHMGRESGPRWNLIVFLFMLLVVLIVVVGSVWIMNNLNYNMMPHEMSEQLLQSEGYGDSHHE